MLLFKHVSSIFEYKSVNRLIAYYNGTNGSGSTHVTVVSWPITNDNTINVSTSKKADFCFSKPTVPLTQCVPNNSNVVVVKNAIDESYNGMYVKHEKTGEFFDAEGGFFYIKTNRGINMEIKETTPTDVVEEKNNSKKPAELSMSPKDNHPIGSFTKSSNKEDGQHKNMVDVNDKRNRYLYCKGIVKKSRKLLRLKGSHRYTKKAAASDKGNKTTQVYQWYLGSSMKSTGIQYKMPYTLRTHFKSSISSTSWIDMTGTDAKTTTKPDQLKPISFASATTNTNTTTFAATATASKDYTFGTPPLVPAPAPAPAPAASFGGFASTAASFVSPVTKAYSFGTPPSTTKTDHGGFQGFGDITHLATSSPVTTPSIPLSTNTNTNFVDSLMTVQLYENETTARLESTKNSPATGAVAAVGVDGAVGKDQEKKRVIYNAMNSEDLKVLRTCCCSTFLTILKSAKQKISIKTILSTKTTLLYNVKWMASVLVCSSQIKQEEDETKKAERKEIRVSLLNDWVTAVPVLTRFLRNHANSVYAAVKSKKMLHQYYKNYKNMTASNQILNDTDVHEIFQMCMKPTTDNKTTTSDLELRREIKSKINEMLHKRAPEQRQKNQANRKQELKQLQKKYSESDTAKRLVKDLQLDASMLTKIGELMAFETELIGLDNVKRFMKKTINDTIGRLRLQDQMVTRHIVIQGNSGSGKKTSAQFIGQWREVIKQSGKSTSNASGFSGFGGFTLNPNQPMTMGGFGGGSSGSSSTPSWAKVGKRVELKVDPTSIDDLSGAPLKKKGQNDKVIKVHSNGRHVYLSKDKDFAIKIEYLQAFINKTDSGIVDVNSLKDLSEKMEEMEEEVGLTFYLHLPERSKDMDAKYCDTLDGLVEEIERINKQWVVIFGGKDLSCLKLNNLHCFKKRELWKIPIASPSHSILAEVALKEIENRGYMLTVGGDINANQAQRKHMMMQIVREKLTKEQIQERNVRNIFCFFEMP